MATQKKNPLGSLVPQTNRELVDLSYKMNMANVPKDLSGINANTARNFNAGLASVGKAFKEVFIAAGEIYAKIKTDQDQEDEETEDINEFKNGGSKGSDFREKYISDTDEANKRVLTDPLYNKNAKIGDEIPKDTDYRGLLDEYPNYDSQDIEDVNNVLNFSRTSKDSRHKNYTGIYGKTINPTYESKDRYGNKQIITTLNFEDYLEDLKYQKGLINKEIKDPKKRKAAKAKIKKKEDTARQSVINFSKVEIEIDEIIASGNLSQNVTGIKGAQFLRAIKAKGEMTDEKVDGKRTRAILGFDENGQAVFTFVKEDGKPVLDANGNTMTVRPGDAKSLVTEVDAKMRTKINGVGIKTREHQAQGNKMTDHYSDNNESDIKAAITTNEQFNDALGFTPNGFSQNFEQALHGYGDKDNLELSLLPQTIFESLPTKFVPDTDRSGGVSAGDFQNEESYKKLVNALTDVKNKNFNLDRSTSIMAKFFNSKFKVDGAAEFTQWGIDNPEELKKLNNTPPPQLTGNELTLQNMSKNERGRQTINRFNTFTNIISSQNPEQSIIDLKQDKGGNITKYVKIDPIKGKIFETTALPGEEPVTNEISYNKLITRLTDNSGMSVEEATSLMGLDLKKVREKFKTKRGDIKQSKSKSKIPDVMGKNEDYATPVLQQHFKKQIKNKDFSITKLTDGSDVVVFTNSTGGMFNYYPFEADITSGNTEAQNMALEAWIKNAKDLNK